MNIAHYVSSAAKLHHISIPLGTLEYSQNFNPPSFNNSRNRNQIPTLGIDHKKSQKYKQNFETSEVNAIQKMTIALKMGWFNLP